jgi:hypothetical protein
MASTLDDLDRRVTALERSHTAAGGALDRIDRKADHVTERVSALEAKVDTMHRVIAESEVRTAKHIEDSEVRLGAKVAETEQRLENRLSGVESKIDRVVDLLDERFDAVMTALDRPKNP